MPPSLPSSDPPSPSSNEASRPSGVLRWGRRLLWGLGGLVGTVVLLLGLLLLGLQTETGATAAAQFLANQANPMPQTTLTVERASGSWIRSLRLTNVSLTRPDAEPASSPTMARIDTLAVRYRLGALLQGRLHVTSLSLSGPSVTMRQARDSTWDWGRALPTTEDAPDDTSATMPIQIDRLHVEDAAFAASFYVEGRDSTAHIENLDLRARALEYGPSLNARLDTLGLQGQLPADTTGLRLSAQGGLSASRLQLDTLQLTSARSRVHAHGLARLPLGPNDSLDDVDLTLQAAPFVLGDVTAFVPSLAVNPEEAIELDARLTGSAQRLSLLAEAQIRDGGHVRVQAEGTPHTRPSSSASPLHYQIDAEAQGLTTSLIGPSDPAENSLTATLTGTLEGRTLDALNGSVQAEVTDMNLSGVQASELTLQSGVEEGTATVDLQGAVNGTTLSVDGTARPLDAAPSMDLTTHVRNLSLATVAPDAGIDGTITASARVRGQSITTDTSTYEVDATLSDSHIGTQPIDTGELSVSVRPDHVRGRGALRFPTGHLRASGQAALDGSERFTLDTARIENVNLAALAGDTTNSRVTATLRGEGQGFDPATTETEASVTVPEAYYGPYRMSALETEAQIDEGQLTTETTARLNESEWTLSIAGRPFAPLPSLELTQARFQNLDVGPLIQDTTQSSALHGTLEGRVQGLSLDTLQLDAHLTLDTSRVNRQRISGATVDATFQEGHLHSTFDLNTPEGAATFTMDARPFDEAAVYDVPSGTFEHLNVGALAGLPDLSTTLFGTLTFTARGEDLSSLSLTSELTLRESTINQSAAEGRLSLSAEQGQVETNGQFSVDGGSVRLKGRIDSLTRTPSYNLRTTAHSLDVGALAGIDAPQTTLHDAQWILDGRGTSLDSLTASTRLSVDSMRIDDFHVNRFQLTGALDQGLFRVDTLSVQSNAVTGRGQGPLALTQGAGSSDFDLQATLTDAAPLRRLTEVPSLQIQRGTVNAHVYGPTEAQQFDGTVELDGLIYNDVRLSDMTGSFTGRRGARQLLGRLEVEANAGYLSAFALTANQTRLQATYDSSTVTLSTDVRLDSERQASLETSFRPAAEPLNLRLHQLNARLGPDQWSLRRETSITLGSTYQIDDLHLESGSQQITMDGTIDFDGPQDFRAGLTEVRLGGIAPLLGFSGLDGTASGQVSLGGTATAPTLDGRVDLALRSQQNEVGVLHLNAGYEDLTVDLDAKLTHTDGSVMTLNGSVPTDLRLQAPSPVDLSDRPVQFSASTERFPMNWVDPFFDPATLRSVTGTLTANAEVEGTLGQPKLSGSASIRNAGASVPPLETTYREGEATVELSGNQLTLTNALIRTSNGGALRANGLITLPELTVGKYDLALSASDFLAIDTRAYRRAVIDGEMTLRGTVRRPDLTGDLQVQRGSVYFSEALAESAGSRGAVALSARDQLTLEERFGIRLTAADTTTFDMYDALALDLSVQVQSDTWLRSNSNPEMNVQFTGDLDVQKSTGEDPQVFGTIEVVEGRSILRQFGQEFQITEGSLTFNGDPVTPYLDLTAVYDQRARGGGIQESEVRITLTLSGRPDNLSPSLSSEPTMSTRNIFSYLATGRPADALFSGGSEGGNLATQVALGQASNFVENLAASELGLDVVHLQVRPEGTSYLTVGRYLTPRFFASIEQPMLTSSSQTANQSTAFIPDVSLEYQLTDYLQLRSQSNQQSLQMNLLFEYAY